MKDFILILPEIFITLTLCFVLVGEVTYHGEKVRLISLTALMGLGAAFVETVLGYQYGAVQIFGHSVSIDGLSLFFKLLSIVLAALAIIASTHSREIPESRKTEYIALILGSALAMSMTASASDFLMAFLSLQLLNILAFFLAGFGKREVVSTEAGVKYMAFCAVAASLLLYGFGIVFSATHSLNIYEIHHALAMQALPRETTLVVFMLIFLAFCFQIAAFPMYPWAPDVLEGSPTPVSAFIAVSSRCAGLAVAVRFVLTLFSQPTQVAGEWKVLGAVDWTQIVALIAGLTMLAGAFLALRQNGAKRLVAGLAIAQSGFLLVGLLVLDQVGVSALLYNLVVDLISLTGIFYILGFLRDEVGSDRLEDLKGMLARAIPECICLVIFLLCLVGMPPLPGFIGKFTLIGVAIRHQRPMLASIEVFTMVLSVLAVARLSYQIVGDFRIKPREIAVPRVARRAFIAGLMIPMALTGIFADFVLSWAGKSLGFILW